MLWCCNIINIYNLTTFISIFNIDITYNKISEKNSSDSDEPTVVLPSKRTQKLNPNIQTTGGERRNIEIDDNDNSSDDESVRSCLLLCCVQIFICFLNKYFSFLSVE